MVFHKVEICGVNTSTLPVLTKEERKELMIKLKSGDMEARERFPSAETIDKIAEALNIRPSVLFDEFGSPNNVQDSFKKIYAKTIQQELKEKIDYAIEEVCKQI